MYSQADREKAYRLLNDIMKHEQCLVLLDGLVGRTLRSSQTTDIGSRSQQMCDVIFNTTLEIGSS
ncbi:hypothetical protein DPMN_176056 [Dreissena polymorpha]|uniref:Uncharacterized protein n=1 Tax=Dreissena polymorpha TaxID=45954 RepID=A0A9D4E8W0_DREPO|nr:hypothetical protein DPMN_176056 [Dreissena polymorpha]